MDDADFVVPRGDAPHDFDLGRASADRAHLEAALETGGFRDGVAVGSASEPHLQAGFVAGYTAAAAPAFVLGILRGVVGTLAALAQRRAREGEPPASGDAVVSAATTVALRERLAALGASIAGAGSPPPPPIDQSGASGDGAPGACCGSTAGGAGCCSEVSATCGGCGREGECGSSGGDGGGGGGCGGGSGTSSAGCEWCRLAAEAACVEALVASIAEGEPAPGAGAPDWGMLLALLATARARIPPGHPAKRSALRPVLTVEGRECAQR